MANNDINMALEIEVDNHNLKKGISESSAHVDKFVKANQKASSRFSKMWNIAVGYALGTLVAKSVLTAISAFKRLGRYIAETVEVAGRFEALQTQLTTLVRSTTKARDLFKDLVKFSAKTPFQLKDIAETTKKLLSFNVAQKKIIPTLRAVGDVAAASGANIREIGFIFGQVRAASKLTGERFIQLQEKAVPIGAAIAKTMGVSEKSVKKMVSEGKVSFEIFEKAFKSLSEKGGQFFQGMIRQSKTWEGILSTLRDSTEIFKADIGNKLLPALKALALGFLDSSKAMDEMAGTLTSEKVSGFIIEKFNDIVEGTKKVTIALGSLWESGKIVFLGLKKTAKDVYEIVTGPEVLAAFQKVYEAIISGARFVGEAFVNVGKVTFNAFKEVLTTIQHLRISWLKFTTMVGIAQDQVFGKLGKVLGISFGKAKFNLEEFRKEAEKINSGFLGKILRGPSSIDFGDSTGKLKAVFKDAFNSATRQLGNIKESIRDLGEDNEGVIKINSLLEIFRSNVNRAFDDLSNKTEQATAGNKKLKDSIVELTEAQIAAGKEGEKLAERAIEDSEIRGKDEIDRIKHQFKKQNALLVAAREQDLITDDEYLKARNELFAQRGDEIKEINKKQSEEEVSERKKALGEISSLQSSGSKKGAKVGRAAAAIQATSDAYAAATAAMKSQAGIPVVGPALGAASYVSILAKGLKAVQSIKAVGFNRGVDSVPGIGFTDSVRANLTPKEGVLSRSQNETYHQFMKAMMRGGMKQPQQQGVRIGFADGAMDGLLDIVEQGLIERGVFQTGQGFA